jgi:hypothetical protein
MQGIPPLQRRPPDQIPESKICGRCKIDKPKSEYRIRVEKRDKKGMGGFRYLNNTCIQCDKEIAAENYVKQRQSPEFIKKHNQWAKQRYWRNRDKLVEKAKEYRDKPSAKENMKKYRQKNKDKIAEQERITKERYLRKNVDPITDKYVARLLVTQGHGTFDEIINNKELIEIKRGQILLRRIKKQMAKIKKNKWDKLK